MQTALKLYNFERRRRSQEVMQIRNAVQFQKPMQMNAKSSSRCKNCHTLQEMAVETVRTPFLSVHAVLLSLFLSFSNWIGFWPKLKCRIRAFLPSISMRRLSSLASDLAWRHPTNRHSDLRLDVSCHRIYSYSAIKNPFNASLHAKNTKKIKKCAPCAALPAEP